MNMMRTKQTCRSEHQTAQWIVRRSITRLHVCSSIKCKFISGRPSVSCARYERVDGCFSPRGRRGRGGPIYDYVIHDGQTG